MLGFEVGDFVFVCPEFKFAGFNWKIPFEFNLIPFVLGGPPWGIITAVGFDYLEDNKAKWASDELIGMYFCMFTGDNAGKWFVLSDNTDTKYWPILTTETSDWGEFENGGWLPIPEPTGAAISELSTAWCHSKTHSWYLKGRSPALGISYVRYSPIDFTGVSSFTFRYNVPAGKGQVTWAPPSTTTSFGPGEGVKEISIPIGNRTPGKTIVFDSAFNSGVWNEIYIDSVRLTKTSLLPSFHVGDTYGIYDPNTGLWLE